MLVSIRKIYDFENIQIAKIMQSSKIFSIKIKVNPPDLLDFMYESSSTNKYL